jgi:predicted Zn-dependent protease
MSALALNPDSLFVNFLMGVLEYKKSDFKKALYYFEKCKTKCPQNFEILFSYVHTLYVLNDYNQALSITEALLEKYPQNVDLLELCAKITFSQNNLEKAESYVVKVLLMEPENLEYVLLRARILIKKMDYIRASALLDVYAKLNDSSKEYLILRAQLQKDWNKNSSAAVDICTKALMYYPDDVDVLLFSASLASETNSQINGMNAITLVNRVLKMSPNNMAAIKISIAEMIKLGMWTEAYTLSKKLLKDDKDDKMNYFNHIDICLALKKNSEAYDLAYKLYQEDSSSEDIQQSYIKVLVANGQRGSALQLINSLMQNANSKMKSFLYLRIFCSSIWESCPKAYILIIRANRRKVKGIR